MESNCFACATLTIWHRSTSGVPKISPHLVMPSCSTKCCSIAGEMPGRKDKGLLVSKVQQIDDKTEKMPLGPASFVAILAAKRESPNPREQYRPVSR